jgi:hypothetical protein
MQLSPSQYQDYNRAEYGDVYAHMLHSFDFSSGLF